MGNLENNKMGDKVNVNVKMIEEDLGVTVSNGIMTFLFVWVAVIMFVMMMIWNYRNGVVELYQRRNHLERFENESIDGKNDSTISDVTDEYQIEIPEKFHQKNSYQNA